jgi:hypothetical protein
MSIKTIDHAKSEIYALNQHIKLLSKLIENHESKKDRIIRKLNTFIKKREKQLNLTAYKKKDNNSLSN